MGGHLRDRLRTVSGRPAEYCEVADLYRAGSSRRQEAAGSTRVVLEWKFIVARGFREIQ
jgi:hypothetical protein